jgi:hypothetical protein
MLIDMNESQLAGAAAPYWRAAPSGAARLKAQRGEIGKSQRRKRRYFTSRRHGSASRTNDAQEPNVLSRLAFCRWQASGAADARTDGCRQRALILRSKLAGTILATQALGQVHLRRSVQLHGTDQEASLGETDHEA